MFGSIIQMGRDGFKGIGNFEEIKSTGDYGHSSIACDFFSDERNVCFFLFENFTSPAFFCYFVFAPF